MSPAEASAQAGFQRRPTDASYLVVTPFDLGPGNQGSIGPDTTIDLAELNRKMSSLVFWKNWNNEFGCSDGRGNKTGDVLSADSARAQMVGGLTIAYSMGTMMAPRLSDRRMSESQVVASVAGQLGDHGVVDWLHGHDNGHRHNLAGCAGNDRKLETLGYMGRHSNVIIPRVTAAVRASGLMEISGVDVTPEMVTGVVVSGATRAQHPGEFTSPAHAVEVAISRGRDYVRYEEKTGRHYEVGTAVTIGDKVFDTRLFADQHQRGGHEQQLFGASFGIFARKAYEIAIARGHTPATATEIVIGGIAFTIATLKVIGSRSLGATIVSGRK